jgi:nucleoside-diphosphate-sugar epimerase
MSDRFVITGAAGSVGGSLVRRLLLRHARVLGIARTPLPWLAPQFTSMVADITEPIADDPAFARATVIHTAAVMQAPTRDIFWKTNVTGTFHALEWAIRHEASHFVLFSTGGVYPYSQGRAWSETDPTDPIGFYGHSKLLAENMAHAYHRLHGLPVTVVRLFFPYGDGQRRGIITKISDSVRLGQELTVNKGGAPRMNPVHLDDVADAVEIMCDEPRYFRVFNLCGDDTFSFLDLVRLFEVKHHRKAVLKMSDKEHGDLLGSNRLLKELGWAPRVRLAAA